MLFIECITAGMSGRSEVVEGRHLLRKTQLFAFHF
jgi:hypothetical protein